MKNEIGMSHKETRWCSTRSHIEEYSKIKKENEKKNSVEGQNYKTFLLQKEKEQKEGKQHFCFFSFSEYFSLKRKCYFLCFLMVEDLSVRLQKFCLGGIAFCWYFHIQIITAEV